MRWGSVDLGDAQRAARVHGAGSGFRFGQRLGSEGRVRFDQVARLAAEPQNDNRVRGSGRLHKPQGSERWGQGQGKVRPG